MATLCRYAPSRQHLTYYRVSARSPRVVVKPLLRCHKEKQELHKSPCEQMHMFGFYSRSGSESTLEAVP